jgi:hypothetical protein
MSYTFELVTVALVAAIASYLNYIGMVNLGSFIH